MWQVPGGRASEQRQQQAPHPRDVLQKLSAERSGATLCDSLKTPRKGIRAGELAGIRYDPHDLHCSDLDLWSREITVCGKGGRPRVVKIGHEAARSARARRTYDRIMTDRP